MKNVKAVKAEENLNVIELEFYIKDLIYLESENPPLNYETKKIIARQMNAFLDSHAALNGTTRKPFRDHEYGPNDVGYRLRQLIYILQTQPGLHVGGKMLTIEERRILIEHLKKTIDKLVNSMSRS